MFITRYGYVNTKSTAGKPKKVEIDTDWILNVRVWTNLYGNPTTAFRLTDGMTLIMVDDFGALNYVHNHPVVVRRKKDLVEGWL